MIAAAPAPSLGRLARNADVERFGMAAITIRDSEAFAAGVALADLRGRGQGRRLVEARQTIAFRVWCECPSLPLGTVAALIGRRDHSAAIHAILAGARARGIRASKVSELRDDHHDAIDWTKFAYHVAGWRQAHGRTVEAAARHAAVARGEWRKAEQGRSLAAGTMLAICAAIDADPLI